VSTSAAQAQAFFDELGSEGPVWVIEDDGGVAAPMGSSGRRVMPFWSRRSRAERIIRTVRAYEGFRPLEISREHFASRWLPGLQRDGLLAGVNWSGAGATGYDLTPDEVAVRLSA
jgi:hypothetical protein